MTGTVLVMVGSRCVLGVRTLYVVMAVLHEDCKIQVPWLHPQVDGVVQG